MLRWFFDAKNASPLEILSAMPLETFSHDLTKFSSSDNSAKCPNSGEATEATEAVLRWRRVVLNLSDEFSSAAQRHPHLAPIFMEAMGNLLEQLLLFGREEDVIALDDWLDFHPPSH